MQVFLQACHNTPEGEKAAPALLVAGLTRTGTVEASLPPAPTGMKMAWRARK